MIVLVFWIAAFHLDLSAAGAVGKRSWFSTASIARQFHSPVFVVVVSFRWPWTLARRTDFRR